MGHDGSGDPEAVRRNLALTRPLPPFTPGSPPVKPSSSSPGSMVARGIRAHGSKRSYRPIRISAYADARVDKFVPGHEQKVSIARTVVHDPAGLIFR